MNDVHRCAVCSGDLYDEAGSVSVQIEGWNGARLWLCGPECAWEAGRRTAMRCGSAAPTLAQLQLMFAADGLEVA